MADACVGEVRKIRDCQFRFFIRDIEQHQWMFISILLLLLSTVKGIVPLRIGKTLFAIQTGDY